MLLLNEVACLSCYILAVVVAAAAKYMHKLVALVMYASWLLTNVQLLSLALDRAAWSSASYIAD